MPDETKPADGDNTPSPDEGNLDYDAFYKSLTDDQRTVIDGNTKNLKSAHERQKEANREMKATLDAAAKDKADADAAKAKSDEEALEGQQKYQELATQRGDQLAAMEPELATLKAAQDAMTTELTETTAALSGYLEGVVTDLKLDDATKELLDGKSVRDQLAWVTKHKDTLTKKTSHLGSSPGADIGDKVSDEEILKNSRPIR